jgi:antitoxin (DNA-binding transcriptional repressor) of toxin-antitoxin stability system
VSVTETQIPEVLEYDLTQHDRPAARVIAHQYSSATFFSLRFLSHKIKWRAF